MSLNWDVGSVEGWEAKLADDALRAKLDVALWGQLSIDCGIRTADDLAESVWRYRYLSRVGEFVAYNGDGERYNPSADDLRPWLGLRTNVAKVTRATWLKRVTQRLADDVSREVANG